MTQDNISFEEKKKIRKFWTTPKDTIIFIKSALKWNVCASYKSSHAKKITHNWLDAHLGTRQLVKNNVKAPFTMS
jgi:hypothetical protein